MSEFGDFIRETFPGWDVDSDSYGMDACLVCPHGNVIEQDGECPEGCVSPMREMGII